MTRGTIITFQKHQAFGRVFRFARGDQGVVEKVLPDGDVVFWSEKYAHLPFRLKSEDLDKIKETGTMSRWPTWATDQKMAHRIAQRYMQANQTDLQWGITQLEAAQGILKEVSDVWSLRGGGQPSVLDEYPAADAAVTAFRGQVSRNLSKHLQALKRIRTAARLTDWSNPRSIQVFLGILTRKTRTFDDQDVQDGSVDMRRKQASAVISKEVWNPREPGEYDTVDFIVVLAWGKGEIILLDGDSYRPLGKVPFMFMADADPSKVALLVDKLVKAKAPKPNFGYSSPSLGDKAPNEHFTER